jgi:hypothetical protein
MILSMVIHLCGINPRGPEAHWTVLSAAGFVRVAYQ